MCNSNQQNCVRSTVGDQPARFDQTIRLHYDPVNFQHLSLIARMFNPTFVNHCDQGDAAGLASAIEGLPNITFALPEAHFCVQFAAKPNAPDADLHSFIEAAPCGVEVRWSETLIWRCDAEGKISERWHVPVAAAV